MLTFEWPEADEEKLWECGDAWGKFAGQLRDLIERGQKAAQGVLNENSDESIAAFGERWKEFVENPGYLTDAADAAELAQNVFYSASIIVIGLKVFVAVQIVYLIVVWAKAIAAAGPTCGGSLAAAAGVTVGVRAAVHLALKLAIQGLQALGKKVVREALEKVSNLIKRLRHGRKNPPGKKPPKKPRGGRPVPKTREDAEAILDDGATIVKQGKGKGHSKIAVRTGGKSQAEQDFAELTEGLDVKTYPNGTKVAQLPDGTHVSLRGSSDGRTTISLQKKGQPDIKYRYDP